WAIGAGETAAPETAADAHRFIRAQARDSFGTEAANSVRILYGGSVKPQYRSLKQKRTLGVTGRWRCLGVTLGRRVMHGTSIQTPAERWPYRGRVGNGDFGANLSYGSGTRDFAAARQSQSAGTRSSGSSDGLLRDGFGNVDGSQLPGGVAVFADGRALVAGG